MFSDYDVDIDFDDDFNNIDMDDNEYQIFDKKFDKFKKYNMPYPFFDCERQVLEYVNKDMLMSDTGEQEYISRKPMLSEALSEIISSFFYYSFNTRIEDEEGNTYSGHSHAHNFEEGVAACYAYPEHFDILEEDKKYYSEQQLLFLKRLKKYLLFIGIKDKVDYPLFPKTGTHWTNIAASYAFDSIIKYMEVLGDRNLLNVQLSEKYIDKNRHPDDDLEQLLNLTFPIKPNKNYYTDVTVIPDSTAVKPNLTTIGDSYFWTISYNIPLDTIFNRHPYWYYNSTIYFDEYNHFTNDINFAEELMSADYIMLNYCTTQLYDLGSKFLPKALVYLCYSEDERNAKVEQLIRNMRNDKNWYNSLSEKAKNQNVSVEEVMRNDAMYLVYQQPESCFDDLKGYKLPTDRNESLVKMTELDLFESKIKRIIDDICSDANWLDEVKKKAEKSGVSLETQLRNDAIWMIDNK